MPIFEKGLPGFFRAFQDRFAGPSHDIGMLTIAKKIWEEKGSPAGGGPDPRAFKKRFATFIGIGGSDWACRMSADFGLRVKREVDQVAGTRDLHPPSAVALLSSVALETTNMAASPSPSPDRNNCRPGHPPARVKASPARTMPPKFHRKSV